MRKLLAVCLFMTMMYQVAMANRDAKVAYIELYSQIAVQEMERSGVPASIKLAQAILESNAGSSSLAQDANNHFGIKCGGSWSGKKMYRKDDDYRKGKLIKSCFRAYPSAESSFIAHTDFLSNQPRYAFLFRLDPTNYKSWARGLKKAGYASDPNYDRRLISIIESYKLDQFDRGFNGRYAHKPLIFSGEVDLVDDSKSYQFINDVKSVLAEDAYSVEDIALNHGVSVKKLLKYNEHLRSSKQILYEGEIIYLQPKRKNFRGKQKYHVIRNGESMQFIAQKYGIKLDELYSKNRLVINSQPEIGERIILRGKISKKKIPRTSMINTKVQSPPTNPDPGNHPVIENDPVLVEPRTNNQGIESGQVLHYIVKSGDTLYKLAKKFNISVDELRSFNKIDNNIIKIGQKLRVSL